MSILPANQTLRRKDAYYMATLRPLEEITNSLRKGDEWELDELIELARRCKALWDAYEARVNILKGNADGN